MFSIDVGKLYHDDECGENFNKLLSSYVIHSKHMVVNMTDHCTELMLGSINA